MLGQFFAAWLGRRMESRRVLAYGMCIAAACNVVLGWLVDSNVASVFLWMCVTMGIHGLAQATGWPHNVALFANWTRRSERGTLFGIWGTCYQFGAIFGKGLAGFLLGWLGLAWSFFGSSLLLVAFTVYFVLRARERPQSVGLSLEDEAEPDVAAPGPRKAGDARESALPPGFVASIVAMGLIYFGFKFLRYALDSWSALILGEHFSMTTSIAAYWSTAFDWIGFLGVLVAGYWSDRTAGSRRTPVIFWMTCRLPRGHRRDVAVRPVVAGPVHRAARPDRVHGDGAGFAALRRLRDGRRQPAPGRARRRRDQRLRIDRPDTAGTGDRLAEADARPRLGVPAAGRASCS